jgi:predicted nuclease of restriction endonuclease-like (RecB) superfamily
MSGTTYISLISEIKIRIREAQVKATLAANAQMITMYWDIGNLILNRQANEGWGTNVIQKLSVDIRKDIPEIKGFSERNLKYMLLFAKEYAIVQQPVALLQNNENQEVIIMQQPVAQLEINKNLIMPQAVAKLEKDKNSIPQQPIAELQNIKNQENIVLQQRVANLEKNQLLLSIPWGHNILLIEKIKNIETRFWYMQQTIENGWSREVLGAMIKSNSFERKSSLTNNFELRLPNLQSELVKQTLKDPYIFDFLTIAEQFTERELETELVKHIQKFLLELETGFAFVGRQYHLEVGDQDFNIDLLFYHLKMRCFVVIDLKKGDFKPEHAGKMNFYCSVIDDILKHKTDEPTIGLILCENKNKIIAEYALKNNSQPIGVSEYEFTKALPDNLKSSLPSIEEIENELSKY